MLGFFLSSTALMIMLGCSQEEGEVLKKVEGELVSRQEALPLIGSMLKKRPKIANISLTEINVAEYSLSGNDGEFVAPLLSFTAKGGNPDYYRFKACKIGKADSCIEDVFEDGEMLCGFSPGNYRFSLQACVDSVWGEKGECSSPFKLKDPFVLRESTSKALKELMNRQCASWAKVEDQALDIYTKLSKSKKISDLGPTATVAQKNCKTILQQISDWGPNTFAHRVGRYGTQISELAKVQFEQFKNQKPTKDPRALALADDRGDRRGKVLVGISFLVSGGVGMAMALRELVRTRNHYNKVEITWEGGTRTVTKPVKITREEWDKVAKKNGNWKETDFDKAYTEWIDKEAKLVKGESLGEEFVIKRRSRSGTEITQYHKEAGKKTVYQGKEHTTNERLAAGGMILGAIATTVFGGLIAGGTLLAGSGDDRCLSDPDIDPIAARLQDNLEEIAKRTAKIAPLLRSE